LPGLAGPELGFLRTSTASVLRNDACLRLPARNNVKSGLGRASQFACRTPFLKVKNMPHLMAEGYKKNAQAYKM
jgi:hypothetical protein